MAVAVKTTASRFDGAKPTKLFNSQGYFTDLGGRTYDVSADGKRFLMIKATTPAVAASSATPLNLVVTEHWFEELRARVPMK
jgi:hypothetical protein